METQTEEHEGEKESRQDLHAALEKLHQELASKEQEISEVKVSLIDDSLPHAPPEMPTVPFLQYFILFFIKKD